MISNSACSAPAAFNASKIAIVSRGVTPREFNARIRSSTVAPCFSVTKLLFCSCAVTCWSGTTTVCPCAERLRLRNLKLRLDLDAQVAMRDGNRRDRHIASNDHCSRSLIHDDFGLRIHLHRDGFDHCDEVTGRCWYSAGKRQFDRLPSTGRSNRPAKGHVEASTTRFTFVKSGRSRTSSKVSTVCGSPTGHGSLHHGAIRNPSYCRMIDGDSRRSIAGRESAENQRALCHRVNVAIRAN